MYYVHAEHPTAGPAGVKWSRYMSGVMRPRLVRPQYAQAYGTEAGAERARVRTLKATETAPQWKGYTLSVRPVGEALGR